MYDGIYDLKEMLLKQLNDYGKKGELSAAILERVEIVSHSAKSVCYLLDHIEESEYSGNMGGGRSYRDGGRSYEGGRSMARGRGSNAKRDGMGRYSSEGYSQDDEMADQLRSMADMAPDDRTRQELNRLATRMEGR